MLRRCRASVKRLRQLTHHVLMRPERLGIGRKEGASIRGMTTCPYEYAVSIRHGIAVGLIRSRMPDGSAEHLHVVAARHRPAGGYVVAADDQGRLSDLNEALGVLFPTRVAEAAGLDWRPFVLTVRRSCS